MQQTSLNKVAVIIDILQWNP